MYSLLTRLTPYNNNLNVRPKEWILRESRTEGPKGQQRADTKRTKENSTRIIQLKV